MRHVLPVAALLVVFGALAQATDPPREPAPAAAPPEDIPAFEEEPAFPDQQPVPRSAPQAAAPGGDAAPAPGQPSREAQAEAEEEVLPPLPPGTRSTGPTPQRFDPSEKVRADFPVSFPVDI